MKALTLTLAIIGAAALVAGFAGPEDDSSQRGSAPSVQLDQQTGPECSIPEAPELEEKATCMLCGSGSTGACKGAQQCRGGRKACRSKGCKISGTSSCSTAANVKKC